MSLPLAGHKAARRHGRTVLAVGAAVLTVLLNSCGHDRAGSPRAAATTQTPASPGASVAPPTIASGAGAVVVADAPRQQRGIRSAVRRDSESIAELIAVANSAEDLTREIRFGLPEGDSTGARMRYELLTKTAEVYDRLASIYARYGDGNSDVCRALAAGCRDEATVIRGMPSGRVAAIGALAAESRRANYRPADAPITSTPPTTFGVSELTAGDELAGLRQEAELAEKAATGIMNSWGSGDGWIRAGGAWVRYANAAKQAGNQLEYLSALLRAQQCLNRSTGDEAPPGSEGRSPQTTADDSLEVTGI